MAKKKEKENAVKAAENTKTSQAQVNGDLSEEQIQYARIQFRKNWKENKELSKYAEITDDDADDDFIEKAKNELNDVIDEIRDLKFVIVPKEDGDKRFETIDLIIEYNEKFNQWENGEWRGVLTLDKMLRDLRDKIGDGDFEVDFSTLMFLRQTFLSPKGTGVAAARWMAEHEWYDEDKCELKEDAAEHVTYSGILRKVNEHFRRIECENKRINIYRNRLQLAYAGLKMNLKVSSLEEFVAFNDAVVSAGLPQTGEEIAKVAAE